MLLGNAMWGEMAKEWCTICTPCYKMWMENEILLPNPGFDYPIDHVFRCESSDCQDSLGNTRSDTSAALKLFSKRTVKELFTARSVTALVLRNQPLTEEVICEAHRILLQHTEHQHEAGIYRATEVEATEPELQAGHHRFEAMARWQKQRDPKSISVFVKGEWENQNQRDRLLEVRPFPLLFSDRRNPSLIRV
jgi:hypothetical protein